jgi:hypothetical protein
MDQQSVTKTVVRSQPGNKNQPPNKTTEPSSIAFLRQILVLGNLYLDQRIRRARDSLRIILCKTAHPGIQPLNYLTKPRGAFGRQRHRGSFPLRKIQPQPRLSPLFPRLRSATSSHWPDVWPVAHAISSRLLGPENTWLNTSGKPKTQLTTWTAFYQH